MNTAENKEEEIHDRLRRIEAGLLDCGVGALGRGQPGGSYAGSRLQHDINRNRIVTVINQIAHLKDDALRWARRVGADSKQIEEFCAKSEAVRLVIEIANVEKHGLGGRSHNNSLLEYEVPMMVQAGKIPDPSDKIFDIVWLAIDRAGKPHPSNVFIPEALNGWLSLLIKLGANVEEWVEKWKPRTLPPGMSRYELKIPEKLLEKMREDAMRRRLGLKQ